MKQGIHPKMNTNVVVTCACGNTFVTQSTLEVINVDICSACNPFYTGTQKLVDTEGRIEKFKKRAKASEEKKARAESKKEKTKKMSQEKQKTPSLKELLSQARKSR